MGWIIGTLILWGLKLIVMPFARLLAGDKVRVVTPAAPTPSGEGALPADPGAVLDPPHRCSPLRRLSWKPRSQQGITSSLMSWCWDW